MPRSGSAARARLVEAALDLFTERSFDAVTTSEIAERAGVTERTFFRHFPDKREVLFDGERLLTGWVETAFAGLPDGVPAWQAIRCVVERLIPSLEDNRAAGDRLAALVEATPAIKERSAAKESHLVAGIVKLLVARGSSVEEASIVASAAWGVLTTAMVSWRSAPGSPLQAHIDRGFALLGRVVEA